MPKKTRKLIIAIDGPAGSGKSTVARRVAELLKLPYIDTGAMYRATTLKALRERIDLENVKSLIDVAGRARIEFKDGFSKQRVFLDGKNVTSAIRQPALTKKVFYVAKIGGVRRQMVRKQRTMGQSHGAVMEGRDIGTVVFPKADFKFFLDAKALVRAKRRYKELLESGKPVKLGSVYGDLKKRDKSDRERKEGPLRQAKDAVYVDTAPLTIEEVVDRILRTVESFSIGKYPISKRLKG
jgi:CMP/dCMP kinase